MHIAVCISGLKLWYSCRYRILSFNYAFWWWKHVKTHVCLSTSEMLLQKSVTVPTVDVCSFCWSTFEFSWSNPNFLLVKSKFWSVVMAHGFLKETISQIRMVNHILYIYISIYIYLFPTCQVRVVRFYQSCSPPPRLAVLLLLLVLLLQFLLNHVCINFHLHFRLANSWPSSLPTLFAKLFANFPAQCAPLDLTLGPAQLSVHCWTSTGDLPSSVCTAGPHPGTCPAQCAPLDLNRGPAQLSVHRWTSTGDLPSSVCTAGPQPGTCPAQCAPLDLNGQIECQKICQIECQKICQIECQIECQKICPNICQKICQIECQKICQIECQKICQIECQKICQIECQKTCQ